MQQPGRERLRPVIEKELLYYDILFALDQGGFLNENLIGCPGCIGNCSPGSVWPTHSASQRSGGPLLVDLLEQAVELVEQ